MLDLSCCDQLKVFLRVVRTTERPYECNSQAGNRQHDRDWDPRFWTENTQNNVPTTRRIVGGGEHQPRDGACRVIGSSD